MLVQLFTYLFILYDIGASTKRQKSWKRNYWISLCKKKRNIHCCLSSNEAVQVKYKCE